MDRASLAPCIREPQSTMADQTEQQTEQQTEPLPGPSGYPVVGNAFAIDGEFPLGSWQRWADEYGEPMRLVPSDRNVTCSPC